MRRPKPLLAPTGAHGWTHIWDAGREQLPIDDDLARTLVGLGIISYSPDDGPNARVYRPNRPWTLERIRDEVLHVAAVSQ